MRVPLIKKCISFLLLLAFFTHAANAQKTIAGKVTDADGNPLADVSVHVKGSTKTTATNRKGDYSIEAASSDSVVFTSVGYLVQTVAVGSRSSISLKLTQENKAMDEVVVVGYGTQKKKDLTGAVSSVKARDLAVSSGPEVGTMLKGKAAGLTIRQNSAQPGGGFDILIRGGGSSLRSVNTPLYVVDGFPLTDLLQPATGNRYDGGTQSVLNSFNPNDIESIEILKDASATAIYGTRAANGVVLITTKKGNEGVARVQYSNNFSVQKYNDPFDVLPLNEWMQVRNDAAYEQWMFDNGVAPYGTKTLEEAQANPINGPYRKLYTQNAINNVGRGTDWFDLISRDGSTAQHNISVTGGNKLTKYFLSGNFYDQKGIVKNSELKRYSVRANVDQEISKYIKTGINLTFSRIDNTNSQTGATFDENGNNVSQYENSGIIRAAMQQGPHIPAIDEEGNYPINPQLATQPNPYSLLTISDQGRIERLLGNFYVDITPIKDLTVKLKAGMDRGYTTRQGYLPKTTLWGALEKGRANIGKSDNDHYLLEATGTYSKQLTADHKFDVLLGVSQEKFVTRGSTVGASGFVTDAFLWNNLNAATLQLASTSYQAKSTLISYFGRLNYNYKGKYLLTFNARRDGAGVFAVNNKWGFFPSVAVGWNVAEESFFSGLRGTISQLKFRISYGQTGNATLVNNSNAFAAYSAYPAWLSSTDTRLIGVSLSRLENPDLKWETTTGLNFGLDFSLFNGKVDGAIEVYNNVVSDLLDTRLLNSYQVVPEVIYNVGKTQSKGFEITINTRNVQTRDFQWRTGFVVSHFRTNWKERADGWLPRVYQNDTDPLRAVYSAIADGIMQIGENKPTAQPNLMPGQVKIKDIDGFKRDENGNPVTDANGRFLRTGAADGRIDEADTKLMGTSDPSFMAGISNTLTYKNFSFGFDFNGLFGRRMVDPNYVAYGFSAYGINANGYNGLRSVKDRWTPTNPSTTVPSSYWGFSNDGVGDFFMQDAWFVRLQNVSLGYTIPGTVFKKIFSSVKVHFDAQNLFTITPYKGIDPETDSYTAAYPYIRTYTVGLNLNF
ncbi:MAG: TonB-dependent receptor [Ferruginibacter sp.]